MIKLPETQPVVRFEAVAKSYDDQKVIDDLSFTIPRGTTFGLLGPNGAGKSTTLKSLMGLLGIDRGKIELFGHDLKSVFGTPQFTEIRQRIGYVAEQHHIYRWMTVKTAIDFVKAAYPTWNDTICAELRDSFKLPLHKKAHQLSKGMRAKLSLLLAISHEPDLLVLDEPTSGLDPVVREEFLHGILQSIGQRAKTIIFSSHSIDDVQRIADRVAMLKDGALIVDQPVDDLLENTKRLRATLADNQTPQWFPESAIWQQVSRREWLMTVNDYSLDLVSQIRDQNPVDSIEVVDLNLEEIFKDYVRGVPHTENSHA